MSSLKFIPELCFTARCRWQLADYVSRPAVWDDKDDLSRPLWAEFDDWNGDDGWLMASHDFAETMIQSYLVDRWLGVDARQSLFVDTFWFGTYRHALGYAYEIRPGYTGRNSDKYPQLEYWLDISRNGYLGFYPTDVQSGSLTLGDTLLDFQDPLDALPTLTLPVDTPIDINLPLYQLIKRRQTPLWHIGGGLDPQRLVEGGQYLNLSLYGHNGAKVRRLIESQRGYLNAGRGSKGVLLMCIDNPCVPPHPNPSRD